MTVASTTGAPLLGGKSVSPVPLWKVVQKLGFIGFYSFGGTQANLAMFYRYLVEELGWVNEATYAEYFALAQSIPGATAVQLLTLLTAYASDSVLGGVLAAVFFSMPAAVAMFCCGWFLQEITTDIGVLPSSSSNPSAVTESIGIGGYMAITQVTVGCAATGVVLMGAIQVAQKLVITKPEKIFWTIAVLGCVGTMAIPSMGGVFSVAVLLIGGVTNCFLERFLGYKEAQQERPSSSVEMGDTREPVSRRTGGILLVSLVIMFCVVESLVATVTSAQAAPAAAFLQPNDVAQTNWSSLGSQLSAGNQSIVPEAQPLAADTASGAELAQLVHIFFSAGFLVFGGGPVVVPLLLLQLTSEKFISTHQFLTGFAIVQLMPGPMFNISAFFGAILGGVPGALLCWTALMVPGVLLALGCLPFLNAIKQNKNVKSALKGINAAAAGLMGGAVIVLWQTLISMSNARICLAIVLFAWQYIFPIKAPYVILLGLVVGPISKGLGLDVAFF